MCRDVNFFWLWVENFNNSKDLSVKFKTFWIKIILMEFLHHHLKKHSNNSTLVFLIFNLSYKKIYKEKIKCPLHVLNHQQENHLHVDFYKPLMLALNKQIITYSYTLPATGVFDFLMAYVQPSSRWTHLKTLPYSPSPNLHTS